MAGLNLVGYYSGGYLNEIILSRSRSRGHMDWTYSLTANQLNNLTRDLRPEDINGTTWFLSNDKSLEEVVDILKWYGFFVVSSRCRSYNALDEGMIAQGWECDKDNRQTEIELYKYEIPTMSLREAFKNKFHVHQSQAQIEIHLTFT